MSREPSFNSPTSEHTLLALEDAIGRALYRASSLGRLEYLGQETKSLTIAIDTHCRQVIKEMKP